jgi:hypothetical protein
MMKLSLLWVLLVPTAAFAVHFNNPSSFTGGAISIKGKNKILWDGTPATEVLYLL